jgi:lipocalin
VTTIVSSLQAIYLSDFPQWEIPVVSYGATVAVAFLGSSSSQKIWVNSRTSGQQLQAEKFLFNQQAGKYNTTQNEESIRIFSERLIQIWNEGHGKWEQTVNKVK